ncbi:MAG: helix-turn-helix domain-containing protein [Rubrivivax sp.]|jgi:transcriptional regulator with XRE-family HTH domain
MDEWTPQQRAEFGERLREARKAKGMTLVEAGAVFDTSKQTINHWEAGRNMPSAEQVARLAEEYGCSVEWLLYGRQAAIFSIELLRHLAQADTETLRRLENSLRGHFDLSPLTKPSSGKQVRAA